MANLGNVAGVIISANPPLEADGVTEKRYVLWAQPVGSLGEYTVKYWSTGMGLWSDLSALNIINDSMAAGQIVSTKTFSKVKILQLIAGVNTVVSYGNFTTYKKSGNTGSGLESGDMIIGWWSASKFIRAIFVSGDPTDLASYTILEDLDF